jgi:hypothetical protein
MLYRPVIVLLLELMVNHGVCRLIASQSLIYLFDRSLELTLRQSEVGDLEVHTIETK